MEKFIMDQVLEKIEKQALQLPEKERGILAEKLLQSLGDQSKTAVDEAWIKEAERRHNNYLLEKTSAIPGKEIISDIKQELGWKK
jgi:putative addiction module component (TIGR02574 family)